MTIAISVSLYNKFDDLEILLDIIRNNWEEDYILSVCSNHPEAPKKVADYEDDIDYFAQGTQIAYHPSDPSGTGIRGSSNKMYRVYDSIRTAVRGALADQDVSHILHVHADAWQLSEEALASLIEAMENNNASVATKFRTKLFWNNSPSGLPDQFVLFDAYDAREVDLFEREAVDYPPHTSIHTILPITYMVKFGWGKIHQYSNRAEEIHWDGKSVLDVLNPARPMFFNPEHGQVHIATEDFPEGLGKALQAHYLKQYGLTEGDRIQSLLTEYAMPEEQLFYQLDEHLADLNQRLGRYGLSVDSVCFGRDMRRITDFTERSRIGKIRYFANMAEDIVRTGARGTILGAQLKKLLVWYRNVLGKPPSDGVRPGLEKMMIFEYYREILDPEDYPEELLGNESIIGNNQQMTANSEPSDE